MPAEFASAERVQAAFENRQPARIAGIETLEEYDRATVENHVAHLMRESETISRLALLRNPLIHINGRPVAPREAVELERAMKVWQRNDVNPLALNNKFDRNGEVA